MTNRKCNGKSCDFICDDMPRTQRCLSCGITQKVLTDHEHANKIRACVAELNDAVAAACRQSGLSVEYDTTRLQQIGMPDNEFLEVKIRKPL